MQGADELQASVSVARAAETSVLWTALQDTIHCSAFQSWMWIGTWLSALPADLLPLLVKISERDGLVALAILIHSPRNERLVALHETGVRDLDAICVEYNGVLVGRHHRLAAYVALIRLVFDELGASWLRIPGTHHADTIREAASIVGCRITEQGKKHCPYVATSQLGDRATYLATRSRNTRQQLGVALRRFEAMGPLNMDLATGRVERASLLQELEKFHQESWNARGQPGMFANAHFRRFHRRLVETSPPDSSELLAVSAGHHRLGILYQLRHGSTVYAYQSGFVRSVASWARPGLVSHQLSIERTARLGLARYNFLAGNERYKTSFATGTEDLHWLVIRD